MLTNGGEILNADQTKCMANSPANIEAATFVRSLVTKKLVNQPGGSYNAFAAAAAGKLGMFGGGIWPNSDIPLSQAQINEQFAIVPWPQQGPAGHPGRRGRVPDVQVDQRNKKALWEFIKFTISEEFQQGPVVNFGGDMPIRQSVGAQPVVPEELPAGHRVLQRRARPTPP